MPRSCFHSLTKRLPFDEDEFDYVRVKFIAKQVDFFLELLGLPEFELTIRDRGVPENKVSDDTRPMSAFRVLIWMWMRAEMIVDVIV